jgi:two-component system, OmpR family, response regulator
MKANIVLVEDNQDIADYVVDILRDQQYVVHVANTGTKGLELVRAVEPELVILDLKLPDITGEAVCETVKEEYPQMKVIMLTAKDTPQDMARGLNIGADDYVPKPFSPEVLTARVNARLRADRKNKDVLELGELILNNKTHEVLRGEEPIELSPQEYRLLEYMMQNPNQVLSRDMILSRLWGTSPDVETRVVDVYIGYLRKKIDKGYKSKMVQSVRGFGYMLTDGSADA